MDDVVADYEVLEFSWDTSHGHMVSMLQERSERGIIIDVGCGSAPHAEVLRDAGFTYVGLDFNPNCVTTLAERGFWARHVDLRNLDGLAATLDDAVSAGRASGDHSDVVALMSLDVMEHLVDPHLALHEMSTWMLARAVPLFGLSVPNVTHRDLSLKLMSARWDLTASGLLDATHLRFFTDSSLTSIMQRCGFAELERSDSSSHWSDQHWPMGSPLLHTVTPLGRFLEDLRDRADGHGSTYQFVRIFEPVAVASSSPTLEVVVPPGEQPFRLAVIADPDMSSADAATLAASLEIQSSDAWTMCEADAIDEGGFSHLTFVGPGQRPSSNWVQQFSDAAASQPGMVLRCGSDPSLIPGGLSDPWPDCFGLIEHLGALGTPGVALAVPVDAIDVLGYDVSASHRLAVAGIGADLAVYCGVHDTLVPAAAARDWRGAGVDSLGAETRLPGQILIGRADLVGLAEARARNATMSARCRQLEAEVVSLSEDNAWLNVELRQTPVRVLRRLLRRPGRRTATSRVAGTVE